MARKKQTRQLAPGECFALMGPTVDNRLGRVSFHKSFAVSETAVAGRETHTACVKGNRYKFDVQVRVHGNEGDKSIAVDVDASIIDSPFSYDCCLTDATYRVSVNLADHFQCTGGFGYQIPTPRRKMAPILPNFAKMRDIMAENSNFLAREVRGGEYGNYLRLHIEAELFHRPCSLFSPKSSLSGDLLCSLSGVNSDDEKGSVLHFLVEGKTFSAHRSILRARGASLLIDLAEETVSSYTSPIPIDGVKQDDFCMFLRYLYADEMPDYESIEETIVALELSDKFGVTSLKLRLEAELAKEIRENRRDTPDSVAELLLLSDAKNCALLKEQAISFFIQNHSEVVKSPGWALLKESSDLQAELWEAFSLGTNGTTRRPAAEDEDDVVGDNELRNKWKRRCVSNLLITLEKASQDLGGPRELLECRLVEYEKKKAAQEAAEVESESNTGSEDVDAVVVE